MINASDYALYGIHSDAERYFWAAYHLFVFLSSLIGDTLILAASFKGGIKVNKSILIIMQHIAVSDLAFSISIVLPANISLFANSWVLGDIICKTRVYISYTVHAAALFLVAFLTTCKLLILKNPHKTAFSSTRVANLGCLIIWLLCCILPITLAVFEKNDIYFEYKIYLCDCMFKAPIWKTLLPIFSVFYIFIPIIIVFITTIPTLKYLLAARKSAQRVGGSVPWHGALAVVLTASVFLLANFPVFIYYVGTSIFEDPTGFFQVQLSRISQFVSLPNIMSNFFIYTLTIPSFRRYILSRGRSVISGSSGQNTI